MLVLVLALAALVVAAGALGAPAGKSDLRISKGDSPDPVNVGTTLSYSIGVENLGPDSATGVTVTDTLPKGVDFVSASPGCAQRGARKVSCEIGALGFGPNYAPPTFTIQVIPRQAGSISNVATVKGDQKDPVGANNRATATTRVLGPVSCRGFAATVTGTSGADVLTGTGGPDVIVALSGADTIRSLSGRDLVCAGTGPDFVAAGSAGDRVFGGSGGDRLLGRGGPDVLRGGAGFDRCRGGAGRDILRSCER